jgi:hypothetical protein
VQDKSNELLEAGDVCATDDDCTPIFQYCNNPKMDDLSFDSLTNINVEMRCRIHVRNITTIIDRFPVIHAPFFAPQVWAVAVAIIIILSLIASCVCGVCCCIMRK